MTTIRTILRKELHDARGNRWLYLYAAVVGLLGVVIAETGIHGGGALSLQVFGRTTATLVNLCLFLAPLVAMTLGTATISAERDQGTLEQLLAQPLTRSELLLGKYLGLWVALFLATIVGFAPAGIIIGLNASLKQALHFLIYPMLSQILISVMLSIGLLISVRARNRAQAHAVGIAIWFICVLAYDILLLGSLSIISLPADALTFLLFLNPVDSSRVLSIITLEPDLYVLGPAGAYLVDSFSSTGAMVLLLGSLMIWTILPLLYALRSFTIKQSTSMNTKKIFRLSFAKGLALLLLSVSLISCGGEKKDSDDEGSEKVEAAVDAPPSYKANVANIEKGKTIYLSTCAPCHGKEGKGDGPAAANLTPKPRDHSKGDYMSKLADEHIGKVIKQGGGFAGFPNMPAQPQLKTEDINALIAFVRTLSQGK